MDTVMPLVCTVAGNSAVTSDNLFCTFICAKSSSVSGVNVSVTLPLPLESAEVVM